MVTDISLEDWKNVYSLESVLSVMMFDDPADETNNQNLETMNQVSEKYPTVKFLRMSMKKNQEFCANFDVFSCKSIILFYRGKRVNRITGFEIPRIERTIQSELIKCQGRMC